MRSAALALCLLSGCTLLFEPEEGAGAVEFAWAYVGEATGDDSVAVVEAEVAEGGSGIFLAVASSQEDSAISSVDGLGLSWRHVRRQCAARSATGVELFVGEGDAVPGTVAAAFSDPEDTAVLVVAHYRGVSGLGAQAATKEAPEADCALPQEDEQTRYEVALRPESSHGRVVLAAATRTAVTMFDTGISSRASVSAGDEANMASLAIGDLPVAGAGEMVAGGSLSGISAWAVVGVELVPE